MPYMTNGVRNYAKEYEWIKRTGTIDKIKKRVKARREMVKKVGAAALRGKDVDHKRALSRGGSNSMSNLRAISSGSNRSFSRNADGSMKSETSKKERKK